MYEFFYVSHFQGQIDGQGKVYKNLVVSDGLRAMKMKVDDDYDIERAVNSQNIKESDLIKVTYTLRAGKNESCVPMVTKVEPKK